MRGKGSRTGEPAARQALQPAHQTGGQGCHPRPGPGALWGFWTDAGVRVSGWGRIQGLQGDFATVDDRGGFVAGQDGADATAASSCGMGRRDCPSRSSIPCSACPSRSMTRASMPASMPWSRRDTKPGAIVPLPITPGVAARRSLQGVANWPPPEGKTTPQPDISILPNYRTFLICLDSPLDTYFLILVNSLRICGNHPGK